WDARGLRTGQTRTVAFPGDRVSPPILSVHEYPPSSFDPSWRTRMTDTYDEQGRTLRRVIEPSSADEPIVDERSYEEVFPDLSVTTRRSGGATPTLDADSLVPCSRTVPPNPLRSIAPRISTMAGLTGTASTVTQVDGFGRPTRFSEGAVEVPGSYDREDRLVHL